MAWAGAGSQSGQRALIEVLEGQDPMPKVRGRHRLSSVSQCRSRASLVLRTEAVRPRSVRREQEWLDLQCLVPDLNVGDRGLVIRGRGDSGFLAGRFQV